MAKLLKLRRGTTSQHSSFTGAEGEVTVDTTKDTIVVHDGSTAGGVPLAKESDNLSLIDEDNMATDSNSRPPSQQSVKAYVDAKVPTSITVADESSDTTCFPLFVTAATGDLAPKSGSNITFNSSTGLLSATAVTTTGNVVVGGNLQVDGTTTTVNSSTMTVTDKNIEIAKGAANDAAADGAGITVDSGDGDKTWNWVDATDAWTSSEHVHLGDSKKVLLGTGSDAEVWHSGSHGYLDNNTGVLHIRARGSASGISLQPKNGESGVEITGDGAVELYHNNIKTFMTSANGLKVLGPEGGNAEIQINSDEGDDNADFWKIENVASDNTLIFQNYTTGSYTTTLKLNPNGALEDSKGDVRKIIFQSSASSAYTLVAADAGKAVATNGHGITIPNNIFAAGDAVTIVNNNASDVTITRAITNLYLGSDGANSASLTLKARTTATVFFSSANHGYISGGGLS